MRWWRRERREPLVDNDHLEEAQRAAFLAHQRLVAIKRRRAGVEAVAAQISDLKGENHFPERVREALRKGYGHGESHAG